jgi:hypothetical protein
VELEARQEGASVLFGAGGLTAPSAKRTNAAVSAGVKRMNLRFGSGREGRVMVQSLVKNLSSVWKGAMVFNF